jgi:phage tail-like protein
VIKLDSNLYDWFQSRNLNLVDRRTVTISMLDETHSAKVSWTLFDAFPVKFSHSPLKSTSNEVEVVSLELSVGKTEVKML